MPEAPAISEPIETRSAQGGIAGIAGDVLAWRVTLCGCWLWTWKELALTWSGYENYRYGYFVPILAAYLGYRRMIAPATALSGTGSDNRGQPLAAAGAWTAAAIAWGIFLLAELMREFDPHWRMVGWLMMVSVTLLTGVYLWREGGAALVKRMAFPVAFAWTAVAWPTWLEEVVTLKLTGLVTRVTVANLQATGIHAVQSGAMIEMAKGNVEIAPACSGISSLQVTLMAALCLGEYYRMRVARRVALVGLGAVLAIVANLVRADVLVRMASAGGAADLLAHHDSVGDMATVATLAGLLALAWGLSRGRGMRAGGAAGANVWKGMGRKKRPVWGEGWGVVGAFALMPVITTAWFSLSPGGPIRAATAPMWRLRDTPVSTGWSERPVTLSKVDLETLGFTEGQTIAIAGPANAAAIIYHFFWNTDASTGYGHTPDNCMVGAGWEQEGEPIVTTLRVGAEGESASFPAKIYRFKMGAKEEVVFQSVWYGGDPMFSNGEFPWAKGGPRTSRLGMLWSEPRRRGLESLNVYMLPPRDSETQTVAAERVLGEVLEPSRGQ